MSPFRRPSVRYGKTPEPETPYQKAAQVWDERIGSARVQARNWRLIAFGNLALAAGVAAGLIWQSTNGTIVPWVVQVDRFGAAQAVAPAIADYRPTDPQIAWHLARLSKRFAASPPIRSSSGKTGSRPISSSPTRARSPSMISPAQTNLSPKSDGFRWRPTSLASSAPREIPSVSPGRNAATRMARSMRPNVGPPFSPSWSSLRATPSACAKIRSASSSMPSTGRRSSASACASFKPPAIDYDNGYAPAVLDADPPRPVKVVALRTPLPLPGQLKPLPIGKPTPEPKDPAVRVATANEAARVQPTRDGYINAVQVYPFTEGALYQVYTAPGQVTDVALQESEQLVGSGPVAAGDTVRWIIGDTESGVGSSRKVHILAKPTRPDLMTNLVINTNRRTYLLELRSTEKTYMASVSWQYPQDQLIALRRQNVEAQVAAPIQSGVDIARLRFRYAIEGDDAPWRPVQVFDDGAKVYIEFPRGIAQGEMPPLFVIGPEGGAELVNYRARQNYYIVDRLFAAAELRLGGDKQQKVRIVRTDGRPR